MPKKTLRPPCPNAEAHYQEPSGLGYIGWHWWAEEMAKTHDQQQCSGCNLWKIWQPKTDEVKTPV